MNHTRFASITHLLRTGTTRRTALTALGAAGLAATPLAAQGKQGAGTKARKKKKQRCAKDAAACRVTVANSCQGEADCIAEIAPCCDTCSANGFVTCFVSDIGTGTGTTI